MRPPSEAEPSEVWLKLLAAHEAERAAEPELTAASN
jgi:hypothetical protein